MNQASELSEAVKLGSALSEPRSVEGSQYIVVPVGFEVKPLEHLQAQPNRVKAAPQFDCVKGFAGYITEFRTDGSKLFVKWTDSGLKAVAVLDYHEVDDPSWCSWSATLHRVMSKEWCIWRAASGKWLAQVEMAEFLQDNAPDVVVPDAAEILEICSTFKSVTSVEFGSGYNIQNGAVQINYTETVGSTAGSKGSLHIPEGFTIGIPVLDRGAVNRILCRFRYKVQEKKLLLRFDIPQVHKILDAVMNGAVSELEALTKLQAFLGQP